MTIVIHRNPDCETSRNVLAFIEAAGEQPGQMRMKLPRRFCQRKLSFDLIRRFS